MCVCAGTTHYALYTLHSTDMQADLHFFAVYPKQKKNPSTWQAEMLVSGASLALRESCAIKSLLKEGTQRPVAPSPAALSLVPTLTVLCFLPLWQSHFGFLPLG